MWLSLHPIRTAVGRGILAVRHKLYQKDQKYWRLDRKRVRSDVAGKMMRLAVSILVAAAFVSIQPMRFWRQSV